MFSQTSEYALRIVTHLGCRLDHCSTISQLAKVTRIRPPYLRKVLDRLREAEIVATRRGAHGGVTLTVEPDQLSLLEVVNAIDPICRIERCPLGLPDHLKLCPLHAQVDEAIAQIEAALAKRTVGDLVASARPGRDRCKFPQLVE